MSNRLTRSFLLLLVLALFSQVAMSATGKGLLWKVERTGVAPSHLFATMHSSDPRILDLPPQVQHALQDASSFTMEMMLDEGAVLAMGQRMLLTDGSQLSDMLDAQLYRQVVEAMRERGIPEQMVGLLKPWAVFMTLSMPLETNDTFLDLKLYRQALQLGKKVYGLESIEEQLDVFDKMSRSDQIALLSELIAQYHEYEATISAMTEAYLERDLDRLVGLSEQSMEGTDADLKQRMMDRLIDTRNRRMAERMSQQLAEGSAFIAVGALHLPGSDGLIELLRRQGYRVTPVY